jgi:hypothetical protein
MHLRGNVDDLYKLRYFDIEHSILTGPSEFGLPLPPLPARTVLRAASPALLLHAG